MVRATHLTLGRIRLQAKPQGPWSRVLFTENRQCGAPLRCTERERVLKDGVSHAIVTAGEASIPHKSDQNPAAHTVEILGRSLTLRPSVSSAETAAGGDTATSKRFSPADARRTIFRTKFEPAIRPEQRSSCAAYAGLRGRTVLPLLVILLKAIPPCSASDRAALGAQLDWPASSIATYLSR